VSFSKPPGHTVDLEPEPINSNRNGFAIGVEDVETSLARVQTWVEDHHYRGYEPFDGLSSWARPLACGNIFAERLLMQLIRQSPVNLRPLLGVKAKDSTKGRGYMAWGYLLLYRATGRSEYLEKAVACLEWLDQHKVSRFNEHSWSNHFDFVSRGGRYSSDDPIIVWTALIGQGYLEAYDLTKRPWFLQIATNVCEWIAKLPREQTDHGVCISYLADTQSSIHNSNMLGAAMLARTGVHCNNQKYLDLARQAMEYSCSRQLADGSWWYAEGPKFHWIDNFHTGYNLESLKTYLDATGDEQYRPHFERGLTFFKQNFFERNGRPRYYHLRTYPVDIQCAAQAIDTLADVSEVDSESLKLATTVARWTIHEMQDKRGYFYYRQYPWIKARTPMLHWGQATMFKALARLFVVLSQQEKLSKAAATATCAGGERRAVITERT
jgi:rhamnogalacturonyl hydrolase YesR